MRTLELTAAAFGLLPEDLIPPGRRAEVSRARSAAALALREKAPPEGETEPMSYNRIARELHLLEHTSVIYAITKARRVRASDPDFAERLAWLQGALDGIDMPRPPRFGASDERVPAVLTRRVKPKNEPAVDDPDALDRYRGTVALTAALRAAHPERFMELAA
jgi:hypothetical protein